MPSSKLIVAEVGLRVKPGGVDEAAEINLSCHAKTQQLW